MQLINNNLSKDEYVFDYFKDNPNEVLFLKSILLNIDEFKALNRNLLKNKDKLFAKKENMNKKIEKNNKYRAHNNKLIYNGNLLYNIQSINNNPFNNN